MDTKEIAARFEETVRFYLNELDSLTTEQLLRKPNEEDWSIGQMYAHLIQSATRMHLGNVRRCLHPEGEDGVVRGGEKTEAGKAVMALGSFPPERIRVPASPQYTPEQPSGKEELVQGLLEVLRRANELEPSLREADLSATVAHPRFGGLNAREWFQLVEMHYRHHLLQLGRLQTAFGIGA